MTRRKQPDSPACKVGGPRIVKYLILNMKRSFGLRRGMMLCALLLGAISMIFMDGTAFSQTISVDAMTGQPLKLIKGQGVIIRFDQPVESVFVADTQIADVRVVSPGAIYVFGSAVGTTNLIALNADQTLRGTMKLIISGNTDPAKQSMKTLQPNTVIDVKLFGEKTVATGKARSVGEAVDTESVIQSYAKPGNPPVNNTTIQGANQVNIRVRFAEVSRNSLERYGLNWSALIDSGSFSFGIVKGSPLATVPGGINAHLGTGNVNVDVLLDALQNNGILTVLAEPNITAVTGQTASFLAGGEVPIPVPAGDRQIGIEYKQFGVSLQFTPALLPNNRISLQVKPEVSTISAATGVSIGGISVPGFKVRRADTTVEIGSGQTFAIAGLFQREETRELEKTPILGDVPILGSLFKSKKFQRNETELVILITPYLVQPRSDRSLKTPLDSPSGALSAPVAKKRQVAKKGYGFYVGD